MTNRVQGPWGHPQGWWERVPWGHPRGHQAGPRALREVGVPVCGPGSGGAAGRGRSKAAGFLSNTGRWAAPAPWTERPWVLRIYGARGELQAWSVFQVVVLFCFHSLSNDHPTAWWLSVPPARMDRLSRLLGFNVQLCVLWFEASTCPRGEAGWDRLSGWTRRELTWCTCWYEWNSVGRPRHYQCQERGCGYTFS